MIDSLTDERYVPDARLARLKERKPLRAVDLFAGCGGMSLGLHRAGYTILGGVEIDTAAVRTYAQNFFHAYDQETYERHTLPCDITKVSPEIYMRTVLQAERPENLVDVIVGGPPCQAFSRIGLAKLRSLKRPHELSSEDERASLYTHYLQYVAFFRPLAVIMENVPDILRYKGRNIAEDIAEALEHIGYRCQYTILNAAFYGVPQLRQRLYLVAILDELNISPSFPEPSHFIELPAGYGAVHVSALLQKKSQRYVPPVTPNSTLLPAFTTQDALADLPPVPNQLTSQKRDRYVAQPVPYRADVLVSAYAQRMREWPGFESNFVYNHITRCLPRDAPVFARMKPGDQYPQANTIAQTLFKQALQEYQTTHGHMLDATSEEYLLLLKRIVPPYSPEKFPNKWWKLMPEKPSRTLTAHIGKDTYTHIHYDSSQARVITVREAARLQSFPDGFKFSDAMGPMFKQIGNSIPPLQSYALGMHVRMLLERSVRIPLELSGVL